jgi:four helix bundle protein
MAQKSEQLKARTKKFAIGIIRLVRTLPNRPESWVIGKQLLRCGTAVAANYRAACRARSRLEFLAKLGIVVEEADETVFWLELLSEAEVIAHDSLTEISSEANELVSIFSAAQLTIKRGLECQPADRKP